MILFYVIDAVAIYAVLKQHPNDSDAAVRLQLVFLFAAFQGLTVPVVSYRRVQPGTLSLSQKGCCHYD